MKKALFWKRSASILLAAVLVICGCSGMAFAEGEEAPKLSPEELQEAVNKALQAEETVEKVNEIQQLLEAAL